MQIQRRFFIMICLLFALGSPLPANANPNLADPLPSWNQGSAKSSILEFVAKVTDAKSPDFVPPSERIATFDNDGTLWTEQPMYNQLTFAVDRVRELAPQHPEWRHQEPFKSILEGQPLAALTQGEKATTALLLATQGGLTTAEFAKVVKNWIATAKHPRFDRPYTRCVYLPMLELMHYLRSNGFITYMVSGSGDDFIRPWSESVYGIPPEKVIGSRLKLKYELRPDGPVIEQLAAADFIVNGPNKPISIQQMIGRRPIAAFGNSDGDLQMLQWATIGAKASFGLIVHHTDAEREWAYDRKSLVGQLDKALDEAKVRGWTVVDMKKDWRVIFP